MHDDPTRMMGRPGDPERGPEGSNMRLLVAGLIAVIAGLAIAIVVIAGGDGNDEATSAPTEATSLPTTTDETTTETEPTTTDTTEDTTAPEEGEETEGEEEGEAGEGEAEEPEDGSGGIEAP